MAFKACNRLVIAELTEVSQPMEEPRRNASSGHTLHKSGGICTVIEVEHPELQFQVCDDGVDCQAKEEGAKRISDPCQTPSADCRVVL